MPIYIYKGNSQVSTNAIRNNKAVKAIYAKEQGKDAVCVWGVGLNILPFTYTKGTTSITITGLKSGVMMKHLRVPDTIENLPVTTIASDAFADNTRLEYIRLPNSLIDIGSRAFYGCKALMSITIPDSVTYIYDSVFKNCTGLTSITIPDSVTRIGYETFSGCTGLTNITIPNGVTIINPSTFQYCTGLTDITLSNSLTRIRTYSFFGCSSLTSITFNGTKAQWNAISKDSDWNAKTGNYTIHCTDGDIPKS